MRLASGCVGVLTYVPDSEAILREFARLVRPGGTAPVIQRDDLFAARSFDWSLDGLVAAGAFSNAAVTAPKLAFRPMPISARESGPSMPR